MEEGKLHVGIHADLLKLKHVYQLNEIKEMAMEGEERLCDAQLCCHAPMLWMLLTSSRHVKSFSIVKIVITIKTNKDSLWTTKVFGKTC